MKTKAFLNRLFTVTLFIPLILITGCTKAPKQYAQGTPPVVNANEIRPDLEYKIDTTGELFQNSRDDDSITRENSLKPIYYKAKIKNEKGVEEIVTGAAGMNMATTFEQSEGAEGKLEKASASGSYANGNLYQYPSGIRVLWRKDAPTYPVWMQILSSYQGTLTVPGEIKELRFKKEYDEFFVEQNQNILGNSFIQKLYNALEGKESSYSCLNPGQNIPATCTVERRPKQITFSFGSLFIAFSGDRKTLYFMALTPESNPGKLISDIDITKGVVLLNPEDTESEENIKFGQGWGTVYEKLNSGLQDGVPPVDALSLARRNYFRKDFSGDANIEIFLSKSKYMRSYKEPEKDKNDEILLGLNIKEGFGRLIRVNGEYIEIKQAEDGTVSLEKASRQIYNERAQKLKPFLDDIIQKEEARDEYKKTQEEYKKGQNFTADKAKEFDGATALKVKEFNDAIAEINKNPDKISLEKIRYVSAGSGFAPNNQLEFVNKFTSLIEENVGKAEGDVVFSTLNGLYKNSDKKIFGASVTKYNPGSDSGKQISFAFNQESGQLSSVAVAILNDEFNKLVIPAITKPFQSSAAPNKSLGGFVLGSTVKLSDIDFTSSGREATVQYTTDAKVTLTTRANYNDKAMMNVVVQDSNRAREKGIRVHAVTLGDFDITLFLKPNPTPTEKDLFRIVGIETNWQVGGVENLCGTDLKVKLGVKDAPSETDKFKHELTFSELLDSALKSAKINANDCFIPFPSSVEHNRTGAYYFPNDGVVLGFDNRELTTITIYTIL